MEQNYHKILGKISYKVNRGFQTKSETNVENRRQAKGVV